MWPLILQPQSLYKTQTLVCCICIWGGNSIDFLHTEWNKSFFFNYLLNVCTWTLTFCIWNWKGNICFGSKPKTPLQMKTFCPILISANFGWTLLISLETLRSGYEFKVFEQAFFFATGQGLQATTCYKASCDTRPFTISSIQVHFSLWVTLTMLDYLYTLTNNFIV